jgi:hypothetical protein
MEDEVREIPGSAVSREEAPPCGQGTIATLFAEVGLNSDIPELRGHEIEPPRFKL